MENTHTYTETDILSALDPKYAFTILRKHKVSYTAGNSSTMAKVSMVVIASTEEEALAKAKSLSKELKARNDFYTFDVERIVEV